MSGPWVKTPINVPPEKLYYHYGDQGTRKVSQSPHAVGAAEMLTGVAPEDTTYASCIKSQQSGCHGKPQHFFELVKSVKNYGKVTQPPICGINCRGEIVIHDGWHRAAAAYAAGLSEIQVSIHWRDEKWLALRHALKRLMGDCKLYAPIDHPDLAYWPHWRKDTPGRIEAVARAIEGCSYVIDVGCHAGVLSFGLARHGFCVTGIDQNPKAIAAAKLLSVMTDIGGDVEFVEARDGDMFCADAVVCLSALNHALVRGRGEDMLSNLTKMAPVVVLDSPTRGDPVGGDTEWAVPGRFMSWVCETAGGSIRALHGNGLQRSLYVWSDE